MDKHLIVTEGIGYISIHEDGQSGMLSSAEADELENYVFNVGLDKGCIIFERHKVRFINYVGFIQLSSCSIEILPKVSGNNPELSRQVLLRMLDRTGFMDVQETELSHLKYENYSLYEIFGLLYVKKLIRELQIGPLLNYVSEQNNLTRVRGKIDLKQQMKNLAMRSMEVNCIYDIFDIKSPMNQILKAALNLLLRRVTRLETQKLVKTCLVLLDEVDNVTITKTLLESVHFNRNNRRYYKSFVLAKLLLSGLATSPSIGMNKNFSILFKMNDLFESYIAYLTKKIEKNVEEQDSRYKLLLKEGSERGVFNLVPDLLIERRDGSALIIDTKWKIINSSDPRHGVQRDDMYQMYAYLTRYKEVDTVILLFPYHDQIMGQGGECLESWHLEENLGKRIKVYSITFENEEEALKELKMMTGT